MRNIKGRTGLSLVEVTIMLLVLMLLTSVLAPSMWDFVHDARWVKVKEDCEAIGLSITRLSRDIGPCFRVTSTDRCLKANRVDILMSAGASASTVGLADTTIFNMNSKNWNFPGGAKNLDRMENQLVTNAPGYPTALDNNGGSLVLIGPLFGLGWRGAYLAPPVGPDPWGTAYYVNSGFLATATDATASNQGSVNNWWESDVFCITAGPNQRIETEFRLANLGRGTKRVSDDFVYVISGSGK